MIKRILIPGLIFGLLLVPIAIVRGGEQDSLREEQRRQKLEKETEKKVLKGKGKILVDWGTSLEYSYENDKNKDKDWEQYDRRSHVSQAEARPWIKMSIRPEWAENREEYSEHILYCRVFDTYKWERPITLEEGDDNEGPKIDMLYLDLDFEPLWFKVGRQFFELGTGITYANMHDGLKISLAWKDWAINSFISRTLPHEENSDFSVPGADRGSKRFFMGGEADYLGLNLHKIFIYSLWEKDNTLEVPENDSQDYHYDAQYLGVGIKKEADTGFNYWLELIGETGKSYCRGSREKSEIIAWASDLGLSYSAESFMKPSLSLRYSFGSGDNSRESVTETERGNVYGNDHNFLYFGKYFAGLTLMPKLSNIHVLGCSLELSPLEKIKWFQEISMGADGYLFFKNTKRGAISDGPATRHENEIGSEFDLFMDWNLTQNLSLGAQYGYFMPGKAYPSYTNDPERYCRFTVAYEF